MENKLTKKAELQKWMKDIGIFATHEVIRWGTEHCLNRSDRDKRDFQREGLIRKLTDEEKEQRGYEGKDALYQWQGESAFTSIQRELFVR